jgi:hypothetical protein
MGLFSLSERLNASVLDDLAAAAMQNVQKPDSNETLGDTSEHWTAAENSLWRWFERENLIDGTWQLTGITTPVNKQTGEALLGVSGYLSETLVPTKVRTQWKTANEEKYEEDGVNEGQPSAERRARHGRPPSKWLRTLNSEELRIWLNRIEVPEAGVNGMTYWTHLTRDHSFDAANIDGLTEEEQAKLHAAAHYGY